MFLFFSVKDCNPVKEFAWQRQKGCSVIFTRGDGEGAGAGAGDFSLRRVKPKLIQLARLGDPLVAPSIMIYPEMLHLLLQHDLSNVAATPRPVRPPANPQKVLNYTCAKFISTHRHQWAGRQGACACVCLLKDNNNKDS